MLARVGHLGARDIQTVLYGYEVLCPTETSQNLWVEGRTGMVTMVKRIIKTMMTMVAHVH